MINAHFSIFRSLSACVVGWFVLAPLAALVPKRRDWVAVIGRQGGQLLDNAKYFYLQCSEVAPEVRCVWVTERAETARMIGECNHAALKYPGLSSIWFLVRCGSVVVDESAWFRRMRYYLLIRAKVLQLWHGIPLKSIELAHWKNEVGKSAWASRQFALQCRLLVYRITGRWARYAVVATTSRFYLDHAFKPAFRARYFPVIGYPRNDFAQSLHGNRRELAWSNVDASISSRLSDWQRQGRRLVLVAPTFRDSGNLPMRLDATTLRTIDAFAALHGVEFIFKFHPAERNADGVSGRHFHVCPRDSDIYPVMPYLDALVTDYSSISMDFLLADKPLLFLIPDGDDYATSERQLQFDPRTMMPGPIVPDWPSLLTALLSEWMHDSHVEDRAALRNKAFDDQPQSEAVPKLISLMRDRCWIPTAPATTSSGGNQDDVNS